MNVENHEIRTMATQRLEGPARITGAQDLVAFGFESFCVETTDFAVFLDTEDGGGHRGVSLSLYRPSPG
jgi:hypothetical protein